MYGSHAIFIIQRSLYFDETLHYPIISPLFDFADDNFNDEYRNAQSVEATTDNKESPANKNES